MRRTSIVVVAALLVLAAWSNPGRAEVYVRVPFFSFTVGPRTCAVGPGVRVFLPWVEVRVSRAPRRITTQPAVTVSPVREEVAPQYDQVQPPPPQPYATAVRAPTVAEFAASFKAAPGSHESTLIHPISKAPVKVRFTLPAGSPRKVRVHRRELVFDYGRHKVKVRFVHDGGVRVIAH